jgi:hypothetical protein
LAEVLLTHPAHEGMEAGDLDMDKDQFSGARPAPGMSVA